MQGVLVHVSRGYACQCVIPRGRGTQQHRLLLSITSSQQPTRCKLGTLRLSDQWFCSRARCRWTVQSQVGSSAVAGPVNAAEAVVQFFEAYNAGDIEGIRAVIAEDCSYHDMIYEEPFVGRDSCIKYFTKVRKTVPSDVKFIIDDITSGDPQKVGVKWHVECGEGVQFPFSRGCSFYTINSQGQITSARDLVESPFKPGGSSLKALARITPVIRELGPKADPATLKELPIAAALVWSLYAGYISFILLGSDLPGYPVWATPSEQLMEVFHESLNFWYINIGLNQVGISVVPDVACPPVSEAAINSVLAWAFMFLPLILTDGQGQKVKNKTAWFTSIMMITNIFFIPYMALRAAPEPQGFKVPPSLPPPSWAPLVGWVGGGVTLLSIAWAVVGRPEFGGIPERIQYFNEAVATNRIFFAFMLDYVLFAIWQVALMGGAPSQYRYVPLFGLAAWLIAGSPQEDEDL